MFRTISVVSLLTSVAFAQLKIPASISSSCAAFLEKLSDDPALDGCTAPLVSATSQYTSGTKLDAAAIASTLSNICSSNSCSRPTVRGILASFYQSCPEEVLSNEDVKKIYDTMYTLVPLKDAMCAKDETTNNYCMTETSKAVAAVEASTGMDAEQMQRYLAPEGNLNFTAFSVTNLPFLFLSPSLESSSLCTTCTRNILSSYIAWENDIMYAPGLGQSVLLGRQNELIRAIKESCGPNFLQGAVQAAGGISGDTISGLTNAASRVFTVGLQGLIVSITSVWAVVSLSA